MLGTALAVTPLAALAQSGAGSPDQSARSTAAVPASQASVTPQLTQVATDLENPWALAFLPDGRMLVTERPGRMRIVTRDGRVGEPLSGVPKVQTGGQGGLLDLVLSPHFQRDHTVFFSFSEPDPAAPDLSRTAVARARLDERGLSQVKVIFRQQPSVRGHLHFGSRLVFGRDGNLWIGLGDRYSERARAQNLDNTLGKVVRIRPDGTVPPDNPFVQRSGAMPEIWSFGHRNIQGAALHPTTGQLWTFEHGPRGGDEVNLDLAGHNYGWPVITWGIDYDGSKIGEGTVRDGMDQPRRYWVPSISPSGATFYTGTRFPAWQGSLLVGGLSGQVLVRLSLDGDRITGEERLFAEESLRIRDVRQGPDGDVYLLIDGSPGRILRVSPQ